MEEEERTLEEARRRELRDFELVSMGLESGRSGVVNGGGSGNGRKRKAEGVEQEEALAAFKKREVEVGGVRKKVFELDETEMARVAREEQERLKRELKREKVGLFPSLFFRRVYGWFC